MKFAAALESKLAALEQDFVRSQLTNENFTDLMEEGLRQAARSLSDERREHIATLISKSLDLAAMSYAESRHFLRVLGELNDVEIIRLASHQYDTYESGQAYWEKHRAILEPIMPTFGSGQDVMTRRRCRTVMTRTCSNSVCSNPRYSVDHNTKQVQVGHDGDLEVRSYSLSQFGRMLLRQLDILVPKEERQLDIIVPEEQR